MKKTLLDTNVVLDVLLDRQPFADASAAVWNAVETRASLGLLPAHAVTTKLIVSNILSVFGVAKADGAVIQAALQLNCSDFEQRLHPRLSCPC